MFTLNDVQPVLPPMPCDFFLLLLLMLSLLLLHKWLQAQTYERIVRFLLNTTQGGRFFNSNPRVSDMMNMSDQLTSGNL